MPEESIQVYLTLKKCVSGLFFCFIIIAASCLKCRHLSSFSKPWCVVMMSSWWRHHQKVMVSSCGVIQEATVSSCAVMCSHCVVMMATLMKLIEKRSALNHELCAPVWYIHWSVTFLKGFYVIKRRNIFLPQECGGSYSLVIKMEGSLKNCITLQLPWQSPADGFL